MVATEWVIVLLIFAMGSTYVVTRHMFEPRKRS